MSLFKKKRLYKIIWAYHSALPGYTEIIEAKNPARAWRKIQKQHALPIVLVSLEELKNK